MELGFKKLRRVITPVLASVLGLGIILSSTETLEAHAAQEVVSSNVPEIATYIQGNGSASSAGIIVGSSTRDDATYDNSYQCTNINGTYYYWKTSDYSTISGKISNIQNNSAEQVAGDVDRITGGLGIRADTETASRSMSGVVPVVNVFLGVVVVVITMGMALYSAFDLCYLSFPGFRGKCEEAKQSGQGIMASNKKTSTGETKLRFVSDDAQYAIGAANTVETGKSAYVIYFGKRIWSYLVLSVLIFIILTGNLDIFVSLALRLVSGVLEIIQGL